MNNDSPQTQYNIYIYIYTNTLPLIFDGSVLLSRTINGTIFEYIDYTVPGEKHCS